MFKHYLERSDARWFLRMGKKLQLEEKVIFYLIIKPKLNHIFLSYIYSYIKRLQFTLNNMKLYSTFDVDLAGII